MHYPDFLPMSSVLQDIWYPFMRTNSFKIIFKNFQAYFIYTQEHA
jgi:hypothetical protein